MSVNQGENAKGWSARRIWVFLTVSFIFSWSSWLSVRLFGDRTILASLSWHQFHIHIHVDRLIEWFGVLGPTAGLLATLIFVSTETQRREVCLRILKFRVGLRFYVFALLAPFIICFAESLVRGLKGVPTFFTGGPVSWFVDVLEYIFLSPFWEEIGWRGFLLPEMQSRHGNFIASLLVGLIWGVWHVPLRIYSAPPHSSHIAFVTLFVIYTVGLSVVLAWLYNVSGGCVILCVIFHAAINAAADSFVTPEANTYGGLSSFEGAIASVWILAAIILVADKMKTKSVFWPDNNSPFGQS